jgi:hypothetical protein
MRAHFASALFFLAVAALACDCTPSKTPVAGAAISVPASSASASAGGEPPPAAARCERGYQRLLDGLHGEMTITAYISRGAPQLNALGDHVAALLEKYRKASHGKVVVRIVNPTRDIDRAAAVDAGLLETLLGESPDEQSAIITKGFAGIVFTYGNERDTIKQLAAANKDGIEFWITNKIREVRDRADGVRHRIGVLTGHDETRLDDPDLVPSASGGPTLERVITQNFPFYAFERVDLTKSEIEIDTSLDGLLVLQLATDLSDSELLRIDRFVTRGKSLVVVASAANLERSDPTMKATLDRHRLELLLSGYGIEMANDVLTDFGAPYKIEIATQNGPTPVRFPQILSVTSDASAASGASGVGASRLDASFPPFFSLPELSFPFASSLELRPEHQPRATFAIVARSTPQTTAFTGPTVDLAPLRRWKPSGGTAQRIVAAAVTGAIDPGLAGNAKAAAAGGNTARAPSRVFVISSSQFLLNPFARAGNRTDARAGMMQYKPGDETLTALASPYAQTTLTMMILAFKNTLDWMANDDDLISCARPSSK